MPSATPSPATWTSSGEYDRSRHICAALPFSPQCRSRCVVDRIAVRTIVGNMPLRLQGGRQRHLPPRPLAVRCCLQELPDHVPAPCEEGCSAGGNCGGCGCGWGSVALHHTRTPCGSALQVLLAAAGFHSSEHSTSSAYWHERFEFKIRPGAVAILETEIFPFLPILRAKAEKVGVQSNQQQQPHSVLTPTHLSSVSRVPLWLAAFRHVHASAGAGP